MATGLVNHPHSWSVLQGAVETIKALQEACRTRDAGKLAELAENALASLSPEERTRIQNSTNWHIQLEADLRGGSVCLSFKEEENQFSRGIP